MTRRIGVLAPAVLATGALVLSAPIQTASGSVTAAGNGFTIVGQSSGFLRGHLRFTGTIPRGNRGAVVEIERLGHETGWKWAPTAHATASRNGAFRVIWRANHIGRFAFRAVIWRSGPASPSVSAIVYRPALATFYGPGFWGHRTACGEVLRPTMLGTANRTLRCGTKVAVYYHGRTTVVPVIDRGPYALGADWDLTMATAQALGMTETVTIGAVSLPPAPPWLAPQLTF